MLMVIFGAGASYDSDPSRPRPRGDQNRPPLANELFQNRPSFAAVVSRFPECAAVIPHLRSSQDIEGELERLQNEATQSPPFVRRLRQIAAIRAYLQVIISQCDQAWSAESHGTTNYLTLLDHIERWSNTNVLLVTFNYDRLLDFAVCQNTGRLFTKIGDYVAGDTFKLVKLHGSVDWGQVVRGSKKFNSLLSHDEAVKALIDEADAIETTPEYVLSSHFPAFQDTLSGKPLVPGIAIPVQTKQRFACPDEHLNLLRGRLPSVSRLLIVGWRGMDKHFVDLLRHGLQPNARVQIVNGGAQESNTVVQQLVAAGVRAARWEPLGHTFTDYIRERAGSDFFHSTA